MYLTLSKLKTFHMKKLLFTFGSIVFMLLLGFYLFGCVDYEMKAELNQDGSGTMNIHYWTKKSNLSMGNKIGDFSFEESQVKSDFSSGNTEVTDLKIEENPADSTKHVKLTVKFKDFNKLSDAKGFAKTKPSWVEGKDDMEFKFVINKQEQSSGLTSSNKLVYEFVFPGEVVSTNGVKDGKKVTWNKTLSDLKEDLVMTASVKKEGKKCGLFGLELPIVVLFGISLLAVTRKK